MRYDFFHCVRSSSQQQEHLRHHPTTSIFHKQSGFCFYKITTRHLSHQKNSTQPKSAHDPSINEALRKARPCTKKLICLTRSFSHDTGGWMLDLGVGTWDFCVTGFRFQGSSCREMMELKGQLQK
jgi:hypothetical protein